MKQYLQILLICLAGSLCAQLKSLPSGGNKKAMVCEMIGITDVTIHYDRPGVRGREGKIFGTDVVHNGFADLGFEKKSPWRAGANENTTIEFSTDVKVEGKQVPAGRYGFFVAYGAETCTIILSKNSTSWGSYFYDEKEDALRAVVKPVKLEQLVERLKYEFINQTENSSTIALQWEKIMIPFTVEVDFVNTSLESFRKELRGEKGFTWEANEQAAAFCARHNVNLEEGLKWATNATFYGDNFTVYKTKAELLEKNGQKEKADSTIKIALEKGTMAELHNYGRRFIAMKKPAEALNVFILNAGKHPGKFMTLAGLARGYSANGQYEKALEIAKEALKLAPDEMNRKSVESMILKLQKRTDIN
jgi:hypothetical protein